MKKLIRLSVMTAALMLIGSSISGCSNVPSTSSSSSATGSSSDTGSSGDSSSETPYVNPAVQLPETMALPEFNAAYTPEAPIEINLWTGFGAAVSANIDTGIAEFEAAYPNIVVTHTSKGGYDNLQKAINLSITSNTYPNVAVGYPDHFAGYIDSQIQYALDPFIENPEYGVDMEDYVADYINENRTFLFKDAAKTNGYTLGLPFNKSTEVMVYNETFFNWAATKDASIVIPETWEEVSAIGIKIINLLTTGAYFGHKIDTLGNKNDAATGTSVLIDLSTITADNFYPFSYDSQSNFFISLVRQWGGQYTEMGPDSSTGYAMFDNAQTVEALTFVKGLYDSHVLGIPVTWGETSYCSIPFKSIKSVMTISSSAGVYNNVPAGDAFQIGVSTVPYHQGGVKTVISQGTNMCIFKTTEAAKALASWLFVRYMTTTYNGTFAMDSGYFPVTYSGLNAPAYQTYINLTEESASNLSKIHAAKVNFNDYSNLSAGWSKFVDPGFVGSSTIREQAGYIIPMLFYGDETTTYPQGAIDYAMSQLGDYIKPE